VTSIVGEFVPPRRRGRASNSGYPSDPAELVALLRGQTAVKPRRVILSGLNAGPRANAFALTIIFALGIFLAAKAEFRSDTSNDALYLYGVTVTSIVLFQMAVAFGRYRDLGNVTPSTLAAVASAPNAPLVTCLVAVHNDADIIEHCLASLVDQTYAMKEIIVIDDASTDGTADALARLAAMHPITVISLPTNVGKKRALAAGILAAKGEVYAFTDSDSIWAADALARCVAILAKHPNVGAVSGHCRAYNADRSLLTRIQDSWYEGQFSVRKAFESAFGAVSCVSGPLAVFRKAAIHNYIPAWEADSFLGQEFRFATDRTLTGFVLVGGQVGDKLKKKHAGSPFLETEFRARDWDIVYSYSARAWTAVPETFSKLVKQQVRWKKSFVRNMFFTGRYYWRKSLPPAAVYYLHILFVFAGPIVAFRHLVYVPAHGNPESALLYLAGIVVVGSMFGLAHWRVEPKSHGWVYRPLMSLISTVLLSWLLIYSLLTIRRMRWAR
jgi:cellulose synthase/poly-beta-1,6-N-acetylglucosamine synthase-like glycosyltransferase